MQVFGKKSVEKSVGRSKMYGLESTCRSTEIVRRGLLQVPRVRHPRTSTKPSTYVTGLLRYSGSTALPTRTSSRVGSRKTHRDTGLVPRRYAQVPMMGFGRPRNARGDVDF